MQRNKTVILSTRSLDDELILEAQTKNISIEVLPFIKVEPIFSSELQQKIEQLSKEPATVVFTSVNSVELVAQKINAQKVNMAWEIFCIGHATGKAVANYFGENGIKGLAGNGQQLSQTIVDAKVNKVVFFCGDQRRDELPALMGKNGIDVKEIIVYKTTLTPKKIQKKYDGILFFSPSAVKSFFQENKLDDQTVLFAIGGTTAEEVKKISKNKIVVSDAPEATMLLEKIISFFQTNHIHR